MSEQNKILKNKTAIAENNAISCFIYIGPNLHKYGLEQNTIFKMYPANLLGDLESKIPLLKQLFVKPSEVLAKQRAVLVKGTPEYLAQNQIREAINNGI